MFCLRKTSFFHSRSWTYYALLLVYFGMKFLPHTHHCVFWVFAEIWVPDSSHKTDNKFFIDHCQSRKEGWFVYDTLLIIFMGEYLSVWPKICPILSQIQWRFLHGISGKNYFGRIFQKFWVNQGYPLPKLVKFRPIFCNFILGPYCAEKTHTSTFICCLHPG